VVGCSKHPKPAPPRPVIVPDAPALAIARSSEQALLDTYAAKIRATPLHRRAPLQVARAVHTTHLAALSTATSTGGTGVVTSGLRAALRASVVQLRGLALAATDGANAALLASIAASHESLAQ
jgi:hypothetical protein